MERILSLLLDVGALIAEPPPAGSPAAAFLSSFTVPKAAPATKQCAACGTSEGSVRGCVGCTNKSVHYCSKECQTSHWVIHKPECRAAQGKTVSESMIVNAKNAIAKREENAKAKEHEEAREHEQMVYRCVQAFINEGPEQVNTFSHTCFGKRRRADLPWFAEEVESRAATFLGLKMEETLSLMMFPDGISSEEAYGRGVLISNPEN